MPEQKDHKLIFNSTEKSNFILNMSGDTLRLFIRRMALIIVICTFLGGFLWMADDKLSYIGASCVTVAGFLSVLMFIISASKNDIAPLKNPSYFMVAAMLIFATISAISSFDQSRAVFGMQGRYEGLIAIISYVGIFIAGTLIVNGDDIVRVFDVITGIGVVQCAIGILQKLAIINDGFFDLNHEMVFGVNLPSGTAGSPIFFGVVLTLFSGIAVAGAVYDKNAKRRIFYLAACLLYMALAIMTCSLVPIIGVPIATIIIAVIELFNIQTGNAEEKVSKKKAAKAEAKKTIFDKPVISVIAILLAEIAMILIAMVMGSVHFYDRGIAYEDGWFKNFTGGQLSLVTPPDFYSYTWKTTAQIAIDYPLTGVGLDQLDIPQAAGQGKSIQTVVNGFDKCYNDYLNTAGTRGFLAVIVQLVIFIATILRLAKNLKGFIKNRGQWFRVAMLASVTAYCMIMVISVSSIYAAPYFWLITGFAWSKKMEPETESTK